MLDLSEDEMITIQLALDVTIRDYQERIPQELHCFGSLKKCQELKEKLLQRKK